MDRPPSPIFASAREQRPGGWVRLRRVLRWVVLLALLAVVVGAVLLWRHAAGRIDATPIEAVAARDHTPEGGGAGGATEVVVVGAAPGADPGTVALVQTSPERESPVALLLPPPLRVGGEGAGARLGDVLADGGAGRLVAAVEDTVGLDVDHYVQVDPAGPGRLAALLGGLEVCLDRAVTSGDGGPVPAGCHRRSPAVVDRLTTTGDGPARLRRQRAVLAGTLAAVSDPGLLVRPLRLKRVLDTVGTAVVASDHDPGVRGMVSLARRWSGIDEQPLDVRTVPGWLDGSSETVYPFPQRAGRLFTAMREGRPLPDVGTTDPRSATLEPGQVTVSVYNGTGKIALASNGAEMLQAEGFDIATRDNADQFGHRSTVVRYVPGHEGHARLVARRFPGAAVEPLDAPREDGAQVVVLLGADAEPVVARAQRELTGGGSGGSSGGGS